MLAPLSIVMMGTGPFAVPTFRELCDSPHRVLALVTQPPREAVGKKPPPISPMRAEALTRGVPIFDPVSINTPEARAVLERLGPELLVVADYGQILKPETLAVAKRGGVNLHGSLLPKYRGAAPINWAIYDGERETGVTVLHITPRVDAGPCLAQAKLEIGEDENAVELETRLAELGAPLILNTIDRLAAGETTPLPQDPAQATKAPRLKKSDGALDWRRSAQQLHDQVRALEPWPKTYTNWLRETEPLRVILGKTKPLAADGTPPAGTVVRATGDDLIVAAGGGWLRIESIQPAGKRLLSAGEFLRGYPVQAGDAFGEAPAA